MSLPLTGLAVETRQFGLFPSVWKLLRLRVRIGYNVFKRSKIRTKVGIIFLLVLAVAAMVGIFLLSSWLLRVLNSPELAQYIDPAQFINAIPTLVLTGAFVLTVLTNFGVLLQVLYLSRDMDFLVTAPLPMRAVFLAKLLEAILPNFALFCAVSLPVLFGLGTSAGFNLLYYPLVVIMLALLALAAGGLASILVMAVARVAPARRVAEILGGVGALVSILCGQSGNIMRAAGVGEKQLGSSLSFITQLNAPWSPLAWAGRGLISIGKGEWLIGFGLSALSLALAGAVFAGTLYLAEHLYYTGWASLQGSVRKKRSVKSLAEPKIAPASRPTAAARLIPAPVRALIVKDFLLLRRDPRNISQLITPLILGMVMLFTTRGGGRNPAAGLSRLRIDNLEVYTVTLLAIFVGWILMLNLATLAFTREGRSYWLLKSAPIRPVHLLAGKFLISYLPALLFCLGYLVLAFFIRGIQWSFLPFSGTIVALSAAGSTGIGLAFGIAGAKLDWDNSARQRLRGASGCIVVIAIAGFLLVDLGLFLLPPIIWQIFMGSTPLFIYLLGLLLGGIAAGLGIILPLRFVLPRLAQIGEA
jgi:ABC-2 type transport system permease protein